MPVVLDTPDVVLWRSPRRSDTGLHPAGVSSPSSAERAAPADLTLSGRCVRAAAGRDAVRGAARTGGRLKEPSDRWRAATSPDHQDEGPVRDLEEALTSR